ncbi:CFI-box-CTERM domain-containing protein [Streptomyces hokutonensis]|uniref:CFI-box-CTERM domain-containing protein n=1 Tax=Streptomyces hokutonensis TaxID=1306990 RepID=UPI0033E2FB6F
MRLKSSNLAFTAGTGHGFETFILNLIRGWIDADMQPRLRRTLQTRINTSVLTTLATRLNRGVPSTMPAGVVLSVRQVRDTTRDTPAGTESVIGVRAALAGFGGVVDKFPALAPDRKCPVSAAARRPDAPQTAVLRRFRDVRLRGRRGGELLIAWYEWMGPPLARIIGRTERRRAAFRTLVVRPAARLAGRLAER